MSSASLTGRTRVLSASITTTADVVEEDLQSPLWYIDTETGTLWRRDDSPGSTDADPSTWSSQGKALPPGDGTAPGKVTGVIVTPTSVQQPDGTYSPGFEVEWTANTETDLVSYEVQFDFEGTTWATPRVVMVGIDQTSVVVDGVLGNASYDFRVRALDTDSMVGEWSDTVTATSGKDSDAPDMPTELVAAPGYRMVGLSWSRATDSDFSFYQVRYYPSATTSEFIIISARSNRVIIDSLNPDVEYGFQVRAIDRSGNVVTSSVDTTAVDYLTNPEAGWTAQVLQTPTRIGTTDLSVNTVVANFITTGTLSTDVLISGTVDIGGVGNPIQLEVFDSLGNQMSRWSDDGLVIWDPVTTNKAVWLYGDSIKFSDVYTGDPGTTTWSTAIDSRGVNASAILFGSDIGGHNRIMNSGMEAAPFPTVARSTKTWTATTDWDDATSTVNLNVSGSELTMTTV